MIFRFLGANVTLENRVHYKFYILVKFEKLIFLTNIWKQATEL